MTGWMKQSLCMVARTDPDEQMTSELRNVTMEGVAKEGSRAGTWAVSTPNRRPG